MGEEEGARVASLVSLVEFFCEATFCKSTFRKTTFCKAVLVKQLLSRKTFCKARTPSPLAWSRCATLRTDTSPTQRASVLSEGAAKALTTLVVDPSSLASGPSTTFFLSRP